MTTKENKQEILNSLCATLQMTEAAGYLYGNPLKEIRYVKRGSDEFAVPIFADGNGEPNDYYPNGYYAVNISGDSGVAVVMDVISNFVRRVW